MAETTRRADAHYDSRLTGTSFVAHPPPQRLTIMGTGGRPVMIFDLDNRKIDIPPGVEVSEAASAVFEALKKHLGW